MGKNTTTNNKTAKNSTNTTTNKNKDGNSTSKFVDKSKSNKKEEQQEITEGNTIDMGVGRVATDIRKNFGAIKERVLEKLAAASVPADALDNARHFLEGVVRDVTVAAQGLTKDALHRIKTHLVDIMPSLSPAITRKMVDDAEKEANGDHTESASEEDGAHDQPPHNGKAPYMSPSSSLFASLVNKPFSRL